MELYAGISLDLGNKIHKSTDSLATLLDQHFRVTKMKFGKRPKGEPPSKGGPQSPLCGSSADDSAPHRGLCGPHDKATVIYNECITIGDIPLTAYDYIVNGKPALEWVMERQAGTADKDSGITNDANLWATEIMHDGKYPLKLFLPSSP